MLEIQKLSVSYGSLKILDNVSFSLPEGRWLMLVGPNGAGKSTIVSAVSRGVKYSGKILWNGTDISSMKPAELARSIGVLTQSHSVGYAFTVDELVQMGRYVYSKGLFAGRASGDSEAVAASLESVGLTPLKNQSVLTLSGGELQRAFLAQLFAQDPLLLVLDEPTNHLDLIYQKQIFSLIGEWIRKTGRSVMSVVHDLSLARAYGTHAALMDRGKLISCGEIKSVLTRENLESVYGMDVYEWMGSMLSVWNDE